MIGTLGTFSGGTVLASVGTGGVIEAMKVRSPDGAVASDEMAVDGAFREWGLCEAPRGARFGDVHTFVNQIIQARELSCQAGSPGVSARMFNGAADLCRAKGWSPRDVLWHGALTAYVMQDAGGKSEFSIARRAVGGGMTLDEAAPVIRDLISGYSYGQSHIVRDGLSLTANPRLKQMRFGDLYRYGRFATSGNCVELMVTAYRDVKALFPHFRAVFVNGNEPRFFNTPNNRHWYLLFYDKEPPFYGKVAGSPETIKRAAASDPLLVDPSYGIVRRGLGRHTIDCALLEGFTLHLANEEVVGEGRFLPMGFDTQDKLFYLGADFSRPSLLSLSVQRPGGLMDELHDLYDPALERVIGDDPVMRPLWEALKALPVERTDDDMRESKNVTVI